MAKAPCIVTYGGFSYRVEPVVKEADGTSCISARLLDASGELSQPLDEQSLTQNFSQRDGAAHAWSVSFQTKKDFFLQRALVERMVEDGDAVELEDLTAPAARPAPAFTQRSLWSRH